MKRRLLAIGCVTLLSAAYIIYGQQRPAPRAVLDQYCVSRHRGKVKTALLEAALKLTLDDKDLAQVRRQHFEVAHQVRSL